MNREQVLEKLQPLSDLKLREVQHGPRTKVMVRDREINFRPGGGSLIPVAEAGRDKFLAFTGMPQGLAGRLSDDTLGRVAGELLAKREAYQLVLKDGQIIDVSHTHPGSKTLAPERVVQAIEKAIPEATYDRLFILDSHVVSLDVVGTEERAVARGDLVRAGASVKFSPVGAMNPMVEAYVHRLVCTNGAISDTVLESFGYGEGDSVWHWFRQSVHKAYRSINKIVDRWQLMMREEIAPGDRVLVLEDLLKQARLSKEASDAVRHEALERPPMNAYDAMNLITQATSHWEPEPVRVLRGRAVAARYASATEHHVVCPTCRRTR